MEFDSGPLTWVKGEIDLALQSAGEALDRFAAGADPTQLRFCRTHVHQVHGALAMVGLDGVTQLTESLELLLGAIEAARLAAEDERLAALRLGLADVRRYLDELLAGAPQQPLRLLAALQALAGARGEPAIHPSELFFPDLARRPPKRGELAAPPDADQLKQLLKTERLRFQKGLLGWLKKPEAAEAGRGMMRDAVAAIESVETVPAARAFWWAALAFLEALADPALAADSFARQLCSRIDAQIRRLLEGGGSVAERVMREALYYVALAPGGLSPVIAEVQSCYGLAALLPSPASPAGQPPQAAVLGKLRENLASTAELWDKFCSGSGGSLAGFADAARNCARLTGESGQTDLKRLGQGLATIAGWLLEDPARQRDSVALEVATAILLLQSAEENFAQLGTDFAQQVDLMVARLHACISGRPVAETERPLLDEMTRKVEERRLLAQVGREIQSNLAQIEQTLDSFFRDPSRGAELARLDAPIAQIGGALAMLGHFPAVNHLKACQACIERFAQPDCQPAVEEFEQLAGQLSLLGFFVHALQQGEKDFTAFAQRMRGETAVAEAPLSVEAQLARQTRATQALAEALRETPEDAGLQDALKQNLQIIEKDADLVADRELGESAKAALAALDSGAAVDAALAALAPAAPLVAQPSPATLQLAEAGHAAIDAELLAIFLEEAREVLTAMGDQLRRLAGDPADLAALTGIRRGTHTLKGSGRMVGLTALGETAWQLEQTCNLWLGQDRSATPELLRMLDDEHAVFAAWVEHLASGQGLAPDPTALIALAATLRGEEVPVAVPAAGEIAAAGILPASSAPEDDLDRQIAAAALEDLLVETPTPREQTLADIFRTEAGGHLHTLIDACAALAADPSMATPEAMTRAAHTLGGIAGTVRLFPLHHLGQALESALLRRDGAEHPDSGEGMAVLRQAIVTLESMFDGLAAQQPPEEDGRLLAALEAIFPLAGAGEVEAPASARIIALPLGEVRVPESQAESPAALPELPDDEIDVQLLPVFLDEAAEQLPELMAQLRAWRADSGNVQAPRGIARLLHTFKGNARMAGAMQLGELTHLLETRVEPVLRGASASPGLIDELEAGCDALTQAVERLRQGQGEADSGAAAVDGETEGETGGARATIRVRADLIDRLVNEAGELSIARTRIEGEMRSLKTSLLDLTENVIRLRRQLREIEIQAESQIQAHVAPSGEARADFDPLELDRFTRFQELTRFMAESVNDVATVQQSLLKNLDDANAAILAQARLNRGLQQELMSVRMLPFVSLAERLYRIVRQTAKEVGKRANLEIVGGQVEVDRSVLDRMQAPLEHMLRNAVTHGIEARARRAAVDKPEVGEITVSLAQEGNEIILSLSDDGQGLDLERIRARAEALGLLQPGQAVEPASLRDFVFQPGFSTADELTQVSGRGIGMDVVRSEVAALGGRIEIDSVSGRGTTFRLYLPVTLAVTQSVLLRVGSQRYAIPSTMVEQVLELKEKPLAALREKGEAEWQGHRYPFHFLPQLLGDSAALPEAHRQYWVLLLRSGTQRVAVQVDELKGNQEIVVKNIGAQLSRVVGIDGATVLGDGQIVLLINPVALAVRAAAAGLAQSPSPAASLHLPTVMVVDDSLTVRKITSRLLMREGYQVLLAKDGTDALEQLGDFVPDVILSDIEMPRMDGFDLVRNLRADERLRSVPVIMITSRTADKHRNYALEIGASHYLGKPYDEAELLGLLAGYVKGAA